MKLVETPIQGVWRIELEPIADSRGFFARGYSEEVFREHGLPTRWPQWNVSFNHVAGTLRGMHFQRAPHEEPKLVRCTRGRIWDVALDLRPGSSTYLQSVGVELSEDNGTSLYVPPGCAHGFQTLVDRSEVSYHMGAFYQADAASGVRWDDPAFGIAWPLPSPVLSPRDAAYPDFVA